MGKVYDKAMEFKRKYPGGIAWRLRSHSSVIEDYLNPDEEVLFAFGAQKNEKFTEILCTFVVVLTNKRILLAHKKLLWGSFLYSITPDLYNDMEIFQGLIWGKLVIDTVKEKVVLTNLPKRGLDEIETTISEFMINAKKKYNNESTQH